MNTPGPHLSTHDGHLCFDGVDLVDLADRLPTPFFVFSAQRIAENVATLRDAFQGRHLRTEVFYASKACSTLWVLEQVKKAGVNVEVHFGPSSGRRCAPASPGSRTSSTASPRRGTSSSRRSRPASAPLSGIRSASWNG